MSGVWHSRAAAPMTLSRPSTGDSVHGHVRVSAANMPGVSSRLATACRASTNATWRTPVPGGSVTYRGRELRKGAIDAIRDWVTPQGGGSALDAEVHARVDDV
jgi:hypothetical protein